MKVNNQDYRTIWLDEKRPDTVHIIDQRLLPHRFITEPLRSLQDSCRAIKEMYVRGAGLIGAAAGFGMYLAALDADNDHFDADLLQAAIALKATRPTARNLAWAVDRQLEAMQAGGNPQEKRQIAKTTAQLIADEDAKYCRRIGEHGAQLIAEIHRRKNSSEPVNILTHCNAGWLAFVDYGSATAPIYAAHRAGINVHVWVDETRPWLQGARLTAWELQEEGVPHTLIADNTGGHLMQHGMVDVVIVGTDRTTRTGDVANKIGTYLKALAAKDCNVPFYVALPSSTFDWQMQNGIQEIPIEQRSGDEISYVTGIDHQNSLRTVRISPRATQAANFGFDVTPARLITGLITERGITEASEEAILALYPEKK